MTDTKEDTKPTFLEKLNALVTSRRFIMAIVGIAAMFNQDVLGLSESDAQTFSQVIMAWIVGDSINKT